MMRVRTIDTDALAGRLERNRLTRRDALKLFGLGATAAALQGCATSPVTGERILVGLSEQQERDLDRQLAPHQFSKDMGAVQDEALNRYVVEVGGRMAPHTHRPTMPYSYRVLNGNYINAYTFPGGAMGLTRGIAVELQNEAELAALLGHEMGHVNARHAAQRQGQALIAQAAVAGIGAAAADSRWGALVTIASQIGASALLASYSRDNEREADALGQLYMLRAGYPASGMTDLLGLLLKQEKQQPSLLQTMFSSHPMSGERVANAQRLAQAQYADSLKADPRRERYMDSTARLRAIKPTIEACQRGEIAMARNKLGEAEDHFASALKLTPQDYPANLLMARCLAAQGRRGEAMRFAEAARSVYPTEGQTYKLGGMLHLQGRDPAAAFEQFDRFDRLLPGDPGITFLKGVSLDGMGERQRAAQHYAAFLRAGGQGDAGAFARSRLQALTAQR